MSRARVLAIARILGTRRGADRVGGGQVVALAGMRSALPLPTDAAAATTTTTYPPSPTSAPSSHRRTFLPSPDSKLDSKSANEPRCLPFKFLTLSYKFYSINKCGGFNGFKMWIFVLNGFARFVSSPNGKYSKQILTGRVFLKYQRIDSFCSTSS